SRPGCSGLVLALAPAPTSPEIAQKMGFLHAPGWPPRDSLALFPFSFLFPFSASRSRSFSSLSLSLSLSLHIPSLSLSHIPSFIHRPLNQGQSTGPFRPS